MLYTLLIIIALLAIITAVVLNLPSFGKHPVGKRLVRIEHSPNYKEGSFQNQLPTPQLTSDKGFFTQLKEFFFSDVKDLYPSAPVPAVQTNLSTLPENSLVWLGHSSYFMNISGKKLLVDPVFHAASPFPFMIKPFRAEYNYSANDIPTIDLLIITHDHWDHLDYNLFKQIKGRVKHVLCTLGVGAHLEYWGYPEENITELDWNEETQLSGLHFTCLPTRHFSGRGITRAKTLWGSYMLQSEDKTLYIGGDSGYGPHFALIAKQFPSIDLALLENGQYNEDWRHIHTLPKELPIVMADLRAKRYFTGHNSKFKLGKHPWHEPLENLKKIREQHPDWVIEEPKIGKVISL